MKTILILALLTSPSSAPLDDEISKRVEALVDPWNKEDGPGGVVAVLRRGKPILVQAFGMASLEDERPNSRSTPFYLASLAKPFTAACVVDAARRGKLDLGESVRKKFPELPEVYEPVSYRNLLHHTSGVLDLYDLSIACDLGASSLGSNEAALKLLTKVDTLCFTPGSRFLYSNSGYLLLAEAVRRATGKDLAEYGRSRFYDPLKMKDVSFLSEDPASPVALAYGRAGSGWKARPIQTGMWGPGGMRASMDDLIAFERAWWRGRFGGKGLREELLKPDRVPHPRLGHYAAGWMLQRYRGQPIERHHGGAFGFSTDLMRFPDQELTIVTLANCEEISATDLSESIADVVLGGDLEDARTDSSVTLTPEEARKFGRLWRDPVAGALWILTPKPDRIVIAALGDLKLDLIATSPTRLEATGQEVPFAVELVGEELRVQQEGKTIAKLERLAFPPSDLPPATDYVGEYRSESLGVRISLTSAGGGRLALTQTRPLLKLPAFLAVARDQYLCDRGAQIDFVRNRAQEVVGLRIHANRAWNIELERVPPVRSDQQR